MDCRFFGLMHQMADALGGANAFARACIQVNTALEGARRATCKPMQLDPDRVAFIWQTVAGFLAAKGLQVQAQGPWFQSAPEEPAEEEQFFRQPMPQTQTQTQGISW
jgi:hypothetical protein